MPTATEPRAVGMSYQVGLIMPLYGLAIPRMAGSIQSTCVASVLD